MHDGSPDRALWRHDRVRSVADSNTRGFRWKLFAVALVVALLVGTVLSLLSLLKPSPKLTFYSIAISEYEDWPPYPWSIPPEGLQRLSVERQNFQQRDLLLDKLLELARPPRPRPPHDPLVIYLGGLAISRAEDIYFVPADARPDEPSTWVPLDQLLEPLQGLNHPRLLIIDWEPLVDFRLGALRRNLFEQFQKRLLQMDQAGKLDFPVLFALGNASTPELGTRPLAFVLEQAFAGAADGWNSEHHCDDWVSIQECCQYALAHLHAWQTRAGPGGYIPGVVGLQGAEVRLLTPKIDAPPGPTLPEEGLGSYPKRLLAAWPSLPATPLRHGGPTRYAKIRQLQAMCLRLEQRWRAGVALDKLQSSFPKPAKQLTIVSPPTWSLAGWRDQIDDAGFAALEAAGRKTIQPFLRKIRSGATVVPQKTKPATSVPPLSEDQAKETRNNASMGPEIGAWLLFEELITPTDPSVGQVQQFAQAFTESGIAQHLAEPAGVQLIAGLPQYRLEYWASLPGTFRLHFRCLRESTRAGALDPRSFPFVQERLKQTDQDRLQAFHWLLVGGLTLRKKAQTQLAKCIAEYRAAQTTGKLLDEAFGQRDYMAYLLAQTVWFAHPEEPNTFTQRWLAACTAMKALNNLLDTETLDETQLQSTMTLLWQSRTQLEQLLQPDSQTAASWAAWLNFPGGTGSERTAWVERFLKSSRAEAETILEQWAQVSAAEISLSSAPIGRDILRARRLVAWIDLHASDVQPNLEPQLETIERAPSEAEWTRLAKNIQAKLAAVARQQSRLEGFRRYWRSWLLPPGSGGGDEAFRQWYIGAQQLYRDWLRQRFSDEARMVEASARQSEDEVPLALAEQYGKILRNLVR